MVTTAIKNSIEPFIIYLAQLNQKLITTNQVSKQINKHITDQITLTQIILVRRIEMKWRSDTIQQFVRYKIQHPQQSYQCLRNYHMEKRQNQHLEKMCKHLQQLKATKDYFLHQLHKLKQITQNEVTRNHQDVNKIDKKCETIIQKYNQLKAKRSMQINKKSKSQIINDYEKQISGIRQLRQREIRILQQEIDRVGEEIGLMNKSGWREQLVLRISSTGARIEQLKVECGEMMVRGRLVKSMVQQLRLKQKALEQKQLQVQLQNKLNKQNQARQKQLLDEQFSQMKLSIQTFHEQLIEKIYSILLAQKQQYRSTYTLDNRQSSQASPIKRLNPTTFSRLSSSVEQPPSNNEMSEVMLFNPNIDFSYRKKSKGDSPPKKKTLQKMTSLHEGLESPRKISLQEKELSSQQNQLEQMTTSITLFTQFLQQVRHQHIAESLFQPSTPIDPLSTSNAQNYISTHYNYQSSHLHLRLDQLIQSQKNKLQSIKDQSQQFITEENTKLTAQEAALNKKEKELDKEIHHLQNKVQKTQQEIAKKNRFTI